MIKTIAIVSLSRGLVGEPFMQWEVELGLKRLEAYGIHVKFMPNACKGLAYLDAHPEKRAEDLLAAFQDDEVDLVLSAIGGDDTYRLLPYLFENGELAQAVRQKPFLGFSDSTVNHFMLHKVGIRSFYGQAFLPDVCELSDSMLPYTRHYLEELLTTGTISQVTPSPVWYNSREVFAPSELGRDMPSHGNAGFVLLQGKPVFSGEILGGCVDTMFDMLNPELYPEDVRLCQRYGLFPSWEEWRGKILLLETSEVRMPPEKYRRALLELKKRGVFEAVSGVLMGKPIDGQYQEEYQQLTVEVVGNPDLPIVSNVNVGHATPRCILPLGVPGVVDIGAQTITFGEK